MYIMTVQYEALQSPTVCTCVCVCVCDISVKKLWLEENVFPDRWTQTQTQTHVYLLAHVWME